VVLRRVLRVESGERAGDLFGRAPGSAPAPREAEVEGELVNVHVHRNEQNSGVHLPEAEVYAVRLADHPAQEKKQAFASARTARIGEQVRGATTQAITTEAAGGP